MTFRSHPGRRVNTRALWPLSLALACALFGAPAHAQQDKAERSVKALAPVQQADRPSLKDESTGPKISASSFVAQKSFKSLQLQDEAIMQLRDLIRSTPASNPQRAEFLFNLGELYWDRAKYYERSSVEKGDECYEFERSGQQDRLKACKRQIKDMLEESKRLRKEATDLNVQIIQNYPSFKDLDKVYFHLGSSLMDDNKSEQALEVFRRLIAEFPNTRYLPEVLLNFGEYYFETEDMRAALKAYEKAAEYKDSPVYTYALYKMGWTHFNLGAPEKAVDLFLQVLRTAQKRTEDPNSKSLIRQTRNDIVRTYAHIGVADKALAFFRKEKVADDEEQLLTIGERLAIHYSDLGKVDESTRMYRQLINLNQQTVRTLDFQFEIVRNQTTRNAYSKESIEELVRLMRLVQLADKGHFKDQNPQKYAATNLRIEELVRSWASTYHAEAQKTKNQDLYAMAYYLYKFYLETFPRGEQLYTMNFFYGELLYQLEKWEEAAAAYEQVIAINPNGEYTEDVVLGTVLSYFKIVNTSEEQAALSNNFDAEAKGETKIKPIPTPKEIPAVHQRLIKACEAYMRLAPQGERIVDVKYTLARAYYDHDHLKPAAALFREIAFQHGEHRLGKIAANLHLDSLNLLQDFESLHQAVVEYIEQEPVKDQAFMQEAQGLETSIRFKKCAVLDEGEKWEEAGQCFIDFARDFPESQYSDKALYNAALDFERQKEIGKAIQIRLHLLKVKPNSDLAPETLFNIGGNFHALAVYSEASNYYELFVKNFPEHASTESALTNASTFRQGLGQYDKALQNYQRYLELFAKKDATKAAEVFFQIAKVYEQQKQAKQAFEQYDNYIKRFGKSGTNDRLLEAQVAVGLYHWNTSQKGNRKKALEEFDKTLKSYERLPDADKRAMTTGRDAAAQAQFMIGESVFEKMVAISISSKDERELQNKLRQKMTVAEEAQKIFEQVILFGRPDWAIAALFRIGTQYQEFADTIRNSPVPARLNEDQQEIYRGILEDRAAEIEARAVKSYEQALDTARKANWFNEYSRKSEIQLAQLRPREYRRPSERRTQPTQFNDGFTRAPFLKTVKEAELLRDFSAGSE